MEEHDHDHDHDHDHEEGERRSIANHLSKRSRRNKGLVVVFDPAARKSFVTGFQKRKKKRRKIAEHEKQLKDRQKRLEDRKERRLALRLATGESKLGVDAGVNNGEDDVDDDELASNEIEHEQTRIGTVVYEDEDITTIVNTCSINMNMDFDSHVQTKQQVGNVAAKSCVLSSKKKSDKRRPPSSNRFKQHRK